MYCPFCNEQDTKVIDSRLVNEGSQVRRRRECLKCTERFTTYETVELNLPRVIKRDGSRENFNSNKLRTGLMKALEKRPVNTEKIEASINKITHQLCASGERETPSQILGEMIMNELKHLDEVAYVRFASVYRSFQDVNAFHKEIQNLLKKQSRPHEEKA